MHICTLLITESPGTASQIIICTDLLNIDYLNCTQCPVATHSCECLELHKSLGVSKSLYGLHDNKAYHGTTIQTFISECCCQS